MAQSLEVNIKTTSDVPQAMDKAKAATNSFSNQVEGIGKKFASSFKDIFLSFLGPMALISAGVGLISKLIAENEKKHADARQAAINDTNELMSAEDKYYEKKKENLRKEKETKEQAKITREDVTASFIKDDPRGKALFNEQVPAAARNVVRRTLVSDDKIIKQMAANKEIQEIVQRLIAEDAKKNPISPASDLTKNVALGSGVIGVGASPQIALAMEANTKLDSIDSKLGELVNAGIARDPTKPLGRQFPLYSPGMSR